MRTTVDLNDELLRQAKKKAAEEGRPLRAIIEDALRRSLQAKPEQKPHRLRLRTQKGRLQPGVCLEDRKSLFDLMDGRG